MFGARSQRSFVFLFSKKKNQKAFVRFLKKLLKRWGRVCLFVDNGPCHHGVIVDEFLRSHRKTFRLLIFLRIRRRLIRLSNAGNQHAKRYQIGFFCRCRQQNTTYARSLTGQTFCLKCLNIYLISYYRKREKSCRKSYR